MDYSESHRLAFILGYNITKNQMRQENFELLKTLTYYSKGSYEGVNKKDLKSINALSLYFESLGQKTLSKITYSGFQWYRLSNLAKELVIPIEDKKTLNIKQNESYYKNIVKMERLFSKIF